MDIIKAVGFDFLGVVAALPSGNVFEQVAQLTGTSRESVVDAYHRYNREFQTGRLSQEDLWRKVAGDIGVIDRFEELWESVTARLPIINAGVLELVDALRAAGYDVGLLSNLGGSGDAWANLVHSPAVSSHFDAIVLSGEINIAKPDPRAFQYLAGQLGVTTGEIVFIDDRPESMAGVEALGIRPVLYRDLARLRHELKQLGVTLRNSR